MARVTTAHLSASVTTLTEQVAALTALLTAQATAQAQFSTPATVAQATAPALTVVPDNAKVETVAPKALVEYRKQDGTVNVCTKAQFAVRQTGAARIGRTLTVIREFTSEPTTKVVAPKSAPKSAPKVGTNPTGNCAAEGCPRTGLISNTLCKKHRKA